MGLDNDPRMFTKEIQPHCLNPDPSGCSEECNGPLFVESILGYQPAMAWGVCLLVAPGCFIGLCISTDWAWEREASCAHSVKLTSLLGFFGLRMLIDAIVRVITLVLLLLLLEFFFLLVLLLLLLLQLLPPVCHLATAAAVAAVGASSSVGC